MSRHIGVLPKTYRQQLERMTLPEIAKEAAHMRGDGRYCGTTTALILKWTVRHKVSTAPGAVTWFFKLYNDAWENEKAKRARGEAQRPAVRPVMGGRRRRRGAYCGFAEVGAW